ncbi:MAG: ABC transporter substrate-binding protein [Pseudomonadota bacterium]
MGPRSATTAVAHYDYYTLEPELAESWQWSSDGTSLTFKIRRDATFHDGAPATAHDVKWSFDRAVNHPSTRGQMIVASMEKAEQFVVVDEHTFRIDVARKDNRLPADLIHPFASISNSKLALQHATADDPSAGNWMKTNSTGGGAYRIESLTPEQYVLVRNETWKCGPKPFFERVIYQVVPEATSRRALLQRGSADIVLDLPPKDVNDLEREGKLQILSVPAINGFEFIGMTNSLKPFDNVKVRQAIAYALPYKQMFDAGIFSRGLPLFDGPAGKPSSIDWPTAFPYGTAPERAKQLLAEGGYPEGLEIAFAFETAHAAVAEPVAILMQEALGKIGVKLKIEKWQGAQMASALEKHEIPFFYQRSAAWLNDPVYAFQIFYQGEHRWNLGHFKNAEFDKLCLAARFESDEAKYREMCIRLKEIAFEEVPVMMLWQPFHDVVAQKDIKNYKYMPHRQIDFRPLTRA